MSRRAGLRVVVAASLALSVALAAGVAPFASSSPDGLQRVAEDHGFAERARTPAVQAAAPAADYAVPGVRDERTATALAGVAGTVAVFLIGGGAALVLRRHRWARADTAST